MSAERIAELEDQISDLETKNGELQETIDIKDDEYRALDDEHDNLKEKWESVERLITDLYHEI